MIEYDAEMELNQGIVVLEFYGSWCAPCKVLMATLGKMEPSYEGLTFIKVDVEQHPVLATSFSVRSVPTLLLLKEGEIQQTFHGIQSQSDLETAFSKLTD